MKKFTGIRTVLFSAVVASLVLAPALAWAKPFKRTRTMELKYAWGTTSLAQFDFYDQTYPGYLPIADITFETDGSFTAFDRGSGSTGTGIYDKRGPNLEITILAPPSQLGVVQYVGSKVAQREFAGEILVNGNCAGHWRGSF